MLAPFAHSWFLPDHKLVIWYPEGIFDYKMASMMVGFMNLQEKIRDEPFNRFANWEKISEVRLKLAELTDLAAARRKSYGSRPAVKSAFLAASPAAYTIAWIFAKLMKLSPIEVRVFREIEAAARWLGVPVEVLQPK